MVTVGCHSFGHYPKKPSFVRIKALLLLAIIINIIFCKIRQVVWCILLTIQSS